jgi:hypothetical protein
MSTPTPAGTTADDEFHQRMSMDADLQLMLCEYIWNLYHSLDLGDQKFEVVGGEDVPGYEDDNETVLLRRMSDGQVFEADIEVNIKPVLTPEEQAARKAHFAELRGQLKLPEASA